MNAVKRTEETLANGPNSNLLGYVTPLIDDLAALHDNDGRGLARCREFPRGREHGLGPASAGVKLPVLSRVIGGEQVHRKQRHWKQPHGEAQSHVRSILESSSIWPT